MGDTVPALRARYISSGASIVLQRNALHCPRQWRTSMWARGKQCSSSRVGRRSLQGWGCTWSTCACGGGWWESVFIASWKLTINSHKINESHTCHFLDRDGQSLNHLQDLFKEHNDTCIIWSAAVDHGDCWNGRKMNTYVYMAIVNADKDLFSGELPVVLWLDPGWWHSQLRKKSLGMRGRPTEQIVNQV